MLDITYLMNRMCELSSQSKVLESIQKLLAERNIKSELLSGYVRLNIINRYQILYIIDTNIYVQSSKYCFSYQISDPDLINKIIEVIEV